MKSYLSLIPISAKVRKRQNRMTVLCIIISVFLVTAIFSVADMMIRTESDFMISNHGNWHIAIKNISQNNADEISNRSDRAVSYGKHADTVYLFLEDLPIQVHRNKNAS